MATMSAMTTTTEPTTPIMTPTGGPDEGGLELALVDVVTVGGIGAGDGVDGIGVGDGDTAGFPTHLPATHTGVDSDMNRAPTH